MTSLDLTSLSPSISSPRLAGVASCRRIPAVEWVVVRFFPCLECSRQPLEPRHTLHRYGTDYTSVSDASTRRHTANSVRYTARWATSVCVLMVTLVLVVVLPFLFALSPFSHFFFFFLLLFFIFIIITLFSLSPLVFVSLLFPPSPPCFSLCGKS